MTSDLHRLLDVIYWLCFVITVYLLLTAIGDFLTGREDFWIGLLAALIVYLVGYVLRFQITRKTDHLFIKWLNSFKKPKGN